MNKRKVAVASAIVTAVLIAGAAATDHIPGMMHHSMSRHVQGMMGDIPSPYVGLGNPLPDSTETVTKGATLFAANCSVCHGVGGRGDGPAGKNLSPQPTDLPGALAMPIVTDDYLFWTISEGGKAFDTAMPAFKEALNEGERWQLIRYLRTLGT
jgi:mono/diheme cytochrome c family protein